MSNRRSMLAAILLIVALAIVVGGAFGLHGGEDHSADADEAAATNDRAGAASDSSQGRSGTSPQAATESRPTPSGEAAPGSVPTVRDGVVIVPEAPGAGAEYRLPGLRNAQPPTPFPTWDDLPTRAVFARGRLVGGYPTRILPSAPGSFVISSSVAPSRDRVQVALVGNPGRAGDRVLSFYRAVLSRAGFQEVSVRAVGGSSAAAFVRGASWVVVTVGPTETSTYSVNAGLVIGEA